MAIGDELGKLVVVFGTKLTDLIDGSDKAVKKVEETGRKIQEKGRRLTTAISAPLGAFAAASLYASATFDKAMTQSTAIMGEMSDSVKADMEGVARSLSETGPFAARELAQAYYYLASAGLNVTQSMKALPVVANFAAAGQFDLARATDLLTDAQMALGLSSKNAEENQRNLAAVGDVLVKANILANASTEQFSEALTNRAGAAARLLGKDMEEIVATLAVFANTGIKGAMAGEQLAIVLRDLQSKAIENKDVFRELGVRVFDDATGEMRNMADIIDDLTNLLGGMSDEGKRTTLMQLGFQDRSVAATMALIGFGSEIRRMEAELRKAGGTTTEVADKQLKNLADQFTILKNKVAGVFIEVGKNLTPTIMRLVGVLGNFTEVAKSVVRAVGGMPQVLKDVAVGVGLVLVAVGPLMVAFGGLYALLPTLIGGLKIMAAIFASPVTMGIAAALAALGALYVLFGKTNAAQREAAAGARQYANEQERLAAALESAKRALTKAEEDYQAALAEVERKLDENQAKIDEYRRKIEEMDPVYKGLIQGMRDHIGQLEQERRGLLNQAYALLNSATAAEKQRVEILTCNLAQQKLNEALAEAEKLHKANADEVDVLGRRLSAWKAYLEAVIPVLSDTDTEVTGAVAKIKELQAALDKLTGLDSATRIREVEQVFADWQATLGAVGAEFRAMGDEQAFLNDRVQVTRTAIQDMIAETLKAGKPLDDLFRDDRFERLRAALKRFLADAEGFEKFKARVQDLLGSVGKLDTAFAMANAEFRITGDVAGYVQAQMSLIEGKMRGIVEEGLKAGKTVDKVFASGKLDPFLKQLQALRESMRGFGEMDMAIASQRMTEWVENLQLSMQDVGALITSTSSMVFSGIGDAVAASLVYQEDWAESFEQMGKRVLASFISTMIQLGMEALAFYLLSALLLKKETAGKGGAYATQAYWATFASAVGPLTAMSLFAGPALAAGLAASSVAMMLAGGAAAGAAGTGAGLGFAGFQYEGGLFMHPALAVIGDRPEVALPLERLHEFIPDGGRGDLEVSVRLEGDAGGMLRVVDKQVKRKLGRRA